MIRTDLGILEITWVDFRELEFYHDITLDAARKHIEELRRKNPKKVIQATWTDKANQETNLDTQWEEDDFSDWEDDIDTPLIGEAGEEASGWQVKREPPDEGS